MRKVRKKGDEEGKKDHVRNLGRNGEMERQYEKVGNRKSMEPSDCSGYLCSGQL
jgi:hypothetical protein